MNVIVIGLGSMGKRRIRLIKQIDSSISIIGVDSKQERRDEARKLYEIDTYDSLNSAFERECECAFVCTSPLSHRSIINTCLDNNLHVFTEINLIEDGYDENIALAKRKNLTLFLSSTFLYRDEVKYIQEEVRKSNSLLSYSYHIGQYLPDWHPWENYTDYFIGDKRTSGCREIMAIDFPWLCKTFGDIKNVKVLKGKKTKLKTSYPDSFLLLIDHENGVQGSVVVDVVSRKAIRNFEVYGEDLYLTWNGSGDGLKKYDIENKIEKSINLYKQLDHQEGYASFVVENAYRNEIEKFFNVVARKEKAEYGFEDDKKVLEIINRIEGE